MIIDVQVKPGSREDAVEFGERIIVRVRARPEKGRANDAVARVLAQALDVAPSEIRVLTPSSRRKRVEIPDRCAPSLQG